MLEVRSSAIGIGSPLSAGHVLHMVRDGDVTSRTEIAKATGLARSTVSQRVDVLLAAGLLSEELENVSTGGRPPQRLRFRSEGGVVLAADLGATHCRIAITDLTGKVLAEEPAELAIAEGPEVVLEWAASHFASLLERTGHSHAEVRGIGIGVPGPVESGSGRAISPPIMPGWHGYSIPDHMGRHFPNVPVMVDNDVNVMAVGEYSTHWRHVKDLVFIKVATGIGAGLIINGQLHRGAQGAAGDLGHVRGSDTSDVVCTCGNTGCVEALASGAALASRLRDTGVSVEDTRGVVGLVRAGNQDAVRLVREAGRAVGVVVAQAVNLLNPAVVVIGGDLAYAEEQLFAGVRETVYRRSAVLATRQLQIVQSRLGDRGGVTGAAVTVLDTVLAPTAIDAFLIEAAAKGITA